MDVVFAMALKDFADMGPGSPDPKGKHPNIPKGWEPRVESDSSNGGYLVTKPREVKQDDPSALELFDQFNMSADNWKITNVRKSTWQNHAGEWLESFRATFVPAGQFSEVMAKDAEALIQEVLKHKPSKYEAPDGDFTGVFAVGDTQIGKVDGGGSETILNNMLTRFDASKGRLADWRKVGYNVGEIIAPWLGDCIEGNQSQGGNAAAAGRTDLSITEQYRVLRRTMMYQIKVLAPLVQKLIVPVIPGNHDEAERRGTIVRSYTDSWAIEAGVAVADACSQNPEAYGNVSFIFPHYDELTVTMETSGTILAMAHGHQFGRDASKWWQAQSHGRQPVGEAHILLGAHLHHHRVEDTGKDRTFIQVPALDGGSNWFRHRQGEDAKAGLLTFLTKDGAWHEMSIL
jgi:hypothetical protein